MSKFSVIGRLVCLDNKIAQINRWIEEGGSAVSEPIFYTEEDYEVAEAPITLLVGSPDPVEVTLPPAASVEGARVTIKRWGNAGNIVTVTPVGADTIDGETTLTLTNDWESKTIRASSMGWVITASVNG